MEILADQRRMLAKYKGKDLTKVPQVLIPYKEVLYYHWHLVLMYSQISLKVPLLRTSLH